MLNVEKATPEYFDELTEIWESSVRATHTFLPEESIIELRPLVRNTYLFAVDVHMAKDGQGQILGFVGVQERRIEMLFVNAKSRGQGAGKALTRFAIDVLGAQELEVNEQNPQALGFYEHMGFVVVGRSEVDNQGNPFPLLHMKLELNV